MEILSSFTTELKGYWLNDKKFQLTEPFEYYMDTISKRTFVVPVGFITDFASIPKIFQWAIKKYGRYDKAAVLHDYLYYTGKVSRSMADKIFLDAMRVLRVSWWKRQSLYRAVRMGGWVSWNKHRATRGVV